MKTSGVGASSRRHRNQREVWESPYPSGTSRTDRSSLVGRGGLSSLADIAIRDCRPRCLMTLLTETVP
jgi:hypothetical protein